MEQHGPRWVAARVRATVGHVTIVPAVFLALAFGLTTNRSVAGAAGTIHYPDLQTLPPSDIGIEYDPTTGQKLLRFSNTIANLGEGPLEVIPTNNPVAGTTDAYQRLYSHDENGNLYVADTVYVGTFIFHTAHNHWHFEDFARYELRDVAADGSIGSTVLSSSDKVSFCLTDYEQVNSGLEHAGAETYIPCSQTDPQGISVGWADVYLWYLEGQSLDITGLPDGDYWLVSTSDPDNRLNEGGGAFETNNTGAVKVQIASELVWIDDALPAGAVSDAFNDAWTWVSSDPTPYSGSLAHQSAIAAGLHQHFFDFATARLAINPGNIIFAYVYLDPANPPSEVMLEWSDGLYSTYRAYWGADLIDAGENGTGSRRYIGPLPPTGQWVRLEVPVELVEMEEVALSGMSFTLFDGRATWDYVGVRFSSASLPSEDEMPPAVAITSPTNNSTVSGVMTVSADATDDVRVTAVQFMLDGADLDHAITAPPYSLNWDTSSTVNGPHTLSAVAHDAAGNQAASSPVLVVVRNNTAPTVKSPPPTILTCSPPDGLAATVSIEVDDADGDTLTVTWDVDGEIVQTDTVLASGPPTHAAVTFARFFTPGTHAVRVTVSDAKDSATGETTETVEADSTPPVIHCPAEIIVPTDTGQCSAVIRYPVTVGAPISGLTGTETPAGSPGPEFDAAVTVEDDCSGATIVCDPPSGAAFPQGTTTVVCTGTDGAGNASTCSFKVTVKDAEAPAINELKASPDVLWPPDHTLVPVSISANATDNCGDPSSRILSVTINEPSDGGSSNNEPPAWEITGPLTVMLRAERSGRGGGRVYTIIVESEDATGNRALAEVTVSVPSNSPP